ncbi:SWIM-type domain-containing protein [Biomphalaria glabrata]|nr:hypothetical protein BgiMline_013551 [Biomphalaria glabrata]
MTIAEKEMYAAPTDKIQTWHQPAPKAISPQKTNDSFSCDKTGLTNFYTSVSMSALAALPQNTPIFSVLQADPKKLNSDIIFYDRTIPLPAFVLSDINKDLPAELQKETTLQNSEQWRRERIYRRTASNVHTILKKQDNFVDFAASLLTNSRKDFRAVLSVRLGKLREPMVKNILRNKFSKYIFRNTGLVVNPLFPFIGASPDGLLYHPDNPMVVEIKRTYNPSRQSLIQLSDKRKDFCLEFSKDKGNFVLKTTHSYYTLIQMQLFCTN